MLINFDDARARLHLAAIVDSSDDAILSKDLEGIITSWNRGAERLFGYASHEIVGRSIRILVPPDRQHEEDDVLARIRSGVAVDHFETIRMAKDGRSLHVSLSVSPIRDVTGAIIGASTIARDMTERVRVERALKEAEATQRELRKRLQALVAASGTLLKSPREGHVRAAILQLAGELIAADGYAMWQLDPGRGAWRITAHAGVSDEFAAASIARTQNGSAPPTLTEPIVAPDVRLVPAIAHRQQIYEREGVRALLTVPLTVANVPSATLTLYYRARHEFSEVEIETARALGNLAATALTTAELHSAQRRSEERAIFLARASRVLAGSFDDVETLRTVAQMAVPRVADWCEIDVVAETGEIERVAVAHVDPAMVALARELSQYPAPEGRLPTIHDTIATGQSTLLPHLSDDMLVAAASSPEHLAALRAIGLTSLMIVPLRTPSGVLGAIAFASGTRRFALADLQFAENVAGHVALAVANARAYQRLAAVNRTKDEFLAVLSHELRTPLNAVLGYTQMLRTGAVPADRSAAALERVERNAASLARMVAELLDMSRIVTGQLRVDLRRVELRPIVDDAVATVAPAAQAKGLQIEVEDTAAGATVLADPDRLRQVLWNLVANAVKFTSRDGVVRVLMAHSDGQIELRVCDTGQGIAPEFLTRIFEPFSQGEARITREHGGLGLGLAIARHLVEAHGGTIRVSSDGLGRGACFTVCLPVAG